MRHRRGDDELDVLPLTDVPEAVDRAHGEEVRPEAEVLVRHAGRARSGLRRVAGLRRVEPAVEPAVEGDARHVARELEGRGRARRLLDLDAGAGEDRHDRRRRDDPGVLVRRRVDVAGGVDRPDAQRVRAAREVGVLLGRRARVPRRGRVERALEAQVDRGRSVVGAGEREDRLLEQRAVLAARTGSSRSAPSRPGRAATNHS